MTGTDVVADRIKRDAERAEEYAKKHPQRVGKKRNKEQAAEYSRRYREKNKERVAESLRKWRERNKDRVLEQRRASYSFKKYKEWRDKMLAEDPDYFNKKNAAARSAPGYKERTRASRIKAKYGLTPEQFDAKLSAQNGVCMICGKPETAKIHGRDPVLSVDHCHATGKVRDLLCRKCNTMVGHAESNDGLVEKVAEYLKRHSAG